MRPSNLACKTFAIACAAAALSPSWANAASAPPMTVAVHPATGPLSSYFDFSARPGPSTKAGTLDLRNRTNHRIVVMLDPVDAVTASTLGSAYAVRGLPVHGQTRWTRVEVRRVALPPHGSRVVRVNVRPPASAKPGDYLSGIGVQARIGAKEQRLRSNVAISSVQRYAIGVLVRIPGPRHPRIQLTRAKVDRDPSGITFSLLGRNSGNAVLQNVTGSILVTRRDQVVARAQIGPGTFVSGTSIAYPVPAPHERPIEGTVYRVRAVMRYRGGIARLDTLVRFGHAAAVRQQSFGGPKARRGGFPISLAVLAILALLAGGAAYFIRHRAKRIPSARPVLDRAIVSAHERSEPLSVIRLSVAHGGSTGALPALARKRIRTEDAICHLDDSALIVIAPDTSPATANALAAELRRDFDRAADLPRVGIDVFGLNGDRTAAEFLARMAGSPNGHAVTTA